ncbi:MAG TPA: DUF2306 domain-containing protein [Allosphingosinicella sp.]|jgi:uncharacterized membrane protein
MIASQIYSAAWRAVVVVLSVEIAVVTALRYFIGTEAPPPPILANAFAHPFLILHATGGVAALLLGPLQFVLRIRTRRPGFHRATGRLYVVACALAAPTGLVLALGTTAGPVVSVGFAIPAILCALFTWLGWRAAVERRFGDHSDWMLRSYAVIATAITLRLLIPASAFLDFDFLAAYRVNSWLAWMINLVLVEYAIRRDRGSAAHPEISPPTARRTSPRTKPQGRAAASPSA